MKTASCHSNQTKELIFVKKNNNTESEKVYLMNVSIKSQLHRAYDFGGIIIVFYQLFCIMISVGTNTNKQWAKNMVARRLL